MRRWQAWFFGPSGLIVSAIVIALVGWLLVGPGAERAREGWPFHRAAPAPLVLPKSTGASPPAGWTDVAKAAMPAVVNIASARTRAPGGSGPFSSSPFFPFFGPEQAPRRERSLGSGVLITEQGYVLTNNHVVEGAQDIRVTLADRRELQARLIGADPRTDLAVLKLPGSGFPAVAFADSGRVEVAEIVLAIGNPFGLSQTVTMGIVSAVGRANLGIADYEDFIQTDAAINPGNSGGALINSRAELIGINTAIFSQSGGYMGIGFAVPSNMAKQVLDQLVSRQRVTRGYLGVSVQELTPAVARGLGVSATRGVLVGDVVPDGPAARAGLQRGDVITAVNGAPVEDAGHFRNLVASTPPGTTLKLTVMHDGQERAAQVAVGELPDPRTASGSAGREPPSPLGLSVADLTPEAARRLGLPPSPGGPVVTAVQPGGLAAEAGIRPGDVVLEVSRRPVRSAAELARALEESARTDAVILVSRGGSTAYLALERRR